MELFTKQRDALQGPRKTSYRVFLLCGVLLISFLAAPAWAGRTERTASDPNHEAAIAAPLFHKATVTITSKTFKKITTSAYTSFAVTTGILIHGPDGKEVSLQNLLLPCEAEVIYIHEQGKPRAKRIDVLRIGPNATRQMLLEGDEKKE